LERSSCIFNHMCLKWDHNGIKNISTIKLKTDLINTSEPLKAVRIDFFCLY
jgi:hypothetical protein